MIIAHNGTCTMHCSLLTDIRIARETGYEGIELIGEKLYRYLDQGFSIAGVVKQLSGFPVVALGYVQDIERHEPKAREALFQECEKMCAIAQELNCPMVQILTGPIGPGVGLGVPESYKDIMAMSWPQLRKVTAENVTTISAIGKRYQVRFYLEALSWAPIHTLSQMLELIELAGCDNVGILVDFWHLFTGGFSAEDIAKISADLIYAVHYCDSARGDGSSHDDRDIWTGAGIIPIRQWIDAVVSTGFDGWWSCELFSTKHWELDPWETARLLKDQLRYLLV